MRSGLATRAVALRRPRAAALERVAAIPAWAWVAGLVIELGALGRARDLPVGRDVLALAEERLVERVLEVPERSLLGRPEARAQDQRRPRLVAGQVDLDAHRLRPPVDVARPVDPQVIAAHLQ